MNIKLFLFFAFVYSLSNAHVCEHDHWDEPLRFLESTSESAPEEGRNLQQAYESIRIYADYTYTAIADEKSRDYVQNQLMPSTISFFQSALKIKRLTTNVKAEYECYDLMPPENLRSVGVSADIIILVATEHNGASNARAISGACGLAKGTNRPSYGVLIFNLDAMVINTVPEQEEFLTTTLHEATHVLGFSKPAYPFFIDPLTNRRLVNHIRTKIVNGQNITLMDTPPLTARLRAYFNCPNIEGAYLENEGGGGNQGTHFERRVFQNELMIGSSRPDQVVSEFVLALLEGTGWYQPDYSLAEKFTWGKGKGCEFYDGPCINSGGVSKFSEYCAPLTVGGCTFNGRGKAFCGAQPGTLRRDVKIPTTWNYWRNFTTMTYLFNDNCPIYSFYANSDCENPTTIQSRIIAEEAFGPTSRCFVGTLTRSATTARTNGYCFQTLCEKQTTGFVVKIAVGTRLITCKQQGSVPIPGFNGTLECPDPQVFCDVANPNYCERGCLGRGTCLGGKCICRDGWGGVDCGQRVYKDNCAKCLNEAVNKSCYGDLCRKNPALV